MYPRLLHNEVDWCRQRDTPGGDEPAHGYTVCADFAWVNEKPLSAGRHEAD
jgi:hypothetical protein